MATSFTLRIGYISGATTGVKSNEAFRILADMIQHHNMLIWESEYERLHSTLKKMRDEDDNSLREYLLQYQAQSGNPHTIDTDEECIFISCSGGGQSRKMKEIAAMIVCRVLIKRMNDYGIPLSLGVS